MLAEKRIVITGAGSGIGRATSILAASYGAKVVCVDLSDGVNDTAAEIERNGGSASPADVSDEAAVIEFIEHCISQFGGIDGIYANAGVSGGRASLTELTVEDWQRTLAVNTVSVFLAIKHSVPHLLVKVMEPLSHCFRCGFTRQLAVSTIPPVKPVISIVQTTAYQLWHRCAHQRHLSGLIETGMTKPTFDIADTG